LAGCRHSPWPPRRGGASQGSFINKLNARLTAPKQRFYHLLLCRSKVPVSRTARRSWDLPKTSNCWFLPGEGRRHYDQLWCTGKVSLPPLKCLSQETRKTCGRASRPGQDGDKGA